MKDAPRLYVPGGYVGRGQYVRGFWYTPMSDKERELALKQDRILGVETPALDGARQREAVQSMTVTDWATALFVGGGLFYFGYKVAEWLLGGLL